LILLGGIGLAAALLLTGPQLNSKPSEILAPLVRVMTIEMQTVELSALTHGTVAPRTESELIPEVAGRVTHVNPNLVSGGFFRAGEELLRIEPLDYELALEQARAGLARTESDVTNARKDANRQDDLVKRQLTSAAQQDEASNRLRIAEATLRQAKAQLSRAERDLMRTRILAPYDGRVRSEKVDIGQFVNRGNSVATIYATDYAEVRLPIHDEELAFLDLPLGGNHAPAGTNAMVTVTARFAGAEHQWQGKVVRTEGELDPKTRMINVVAQIDKPYEPSDTRPPLAVGLFVDAEIHGKRVNNVVIIPRPALRANSQVLIIDANNQLRYRDVQILRQVNEQIYLSAGLENGERLCISALDNALEGMTVRTSAPANSSPANNNQANPL